MQRIKTGFFMPVTGVWQSLVRQLNFYNFRKVSKERILWVYRHKLFRRDRPDLLECLRRKPSASVVKRERVMRSNSYGSTSSSGSSYTGEQPLLRFTAFSASSLLT